MDLTNTIARLTAPGQFEFFEEPVPEPSLDQVVIELICSGICSSEIPFFTGQASPDEDMFIKYARYPLNLGHEWVGRVVATGPEVLRFKPYDLVTGLSTYKSCFAKYLVETQANLELVPKNVNPETALGEPVACTINILQCSAPQIGDSVVIIGDGFMGLLMVQLFSLFPLRSLILIGLDEAKLLLGKSFGAHETALYKDIKGNNQILKKDNTDIVIELAGNQLALELAAWLVKDHDGRLVIPSYYSKSEPFTIGGYLMRKAPRLIPAHPAYSDNFKNDLIKGMWALSQKKISLDKLISQKFDYQELNNAFKYAASKPSEYIKGVIIF